MNYKAGVVGAAGFTGIELVRLLLDHPNFTLTTVTSDSLAHEPVSKAYPALSGRTDLEFSSNEDADLSACDIVFLAVPHTAAMRIVPSLLEEVQVVVDLSADFRLKDPEIYQKWYGVEHTASELLSQASFGLPEVLPDEIDKARTRFAEGLPVLVACAGCYPTASALAAAPVIKAGLIDPSATVVIDAISGITGAGKKANERTHFCFANENLEAYGVGVHRHTPEIEQILGLEGHLVFTPHLAPLNRGLLSTVTLPLIADVALPSVDLLEGIYDDFYAAQPFVEVIHAPAMPKTASVAGTDYAHVGVALHETTRMVIAVCAIDNLGKGSAGQAVQCANITVGLPVDAGLGQISNPI